MQTPQVDVIMGVYEPGREMLAAAVASIMEQTLKDLRLIICDDGSRDDTFEWLRARAAADKRILLLRHAQNRGLAAALNTCMRYASASYVARQDADDYSLPERLARQIRYLEEHPEHAFVGSSLYLFDEARAAWGLKRYPPLPRKEDFLFSVPFMHGAMVFRREALLSSGGYRECRRTRRTEDYELLMRMYAAGLSGANLPAPLYAFREDEAALRRRKYRYRLDESLVRWEGFSRMGVLPKGLPFVVKPLVVGLIPAPLLGELKKRHYHLLQMQR